MSNAAGLPIVAISLAHTDSFGECVAEVARERRFLAIVEGFSPEETALWVQINRVRGNPTFVAIDADRVVGWCEVRRETLAGREHSGVLGLGVRAAYRGVGLGGRLMQIAMADAGRRGFERVELWVRSGNDRAMALYRRFGFEQEGCRRDALRIDGVSEDEYLMARSITAGDPPYHELTREAQ
jgi:ribosomal protein S18 acetylase RimI-like enzyme